MFQKIIGNVKKEQITAAVSAGIFYCLTNGYRFFHTSFSGDALLMIHQSDAAWQIALGRFVEPFLVLLRGGITAPFLISVLALLWISLATALTVTTLELKHPVSLILTGGVMAATPAFIAMNAGFLLCVDMYAFALFLAVLSVWCFRKRTVPSLMGGIGALIGSIGIYQAFVCVTVGLLMLLLMVDLRKEEEYKDVPRRMGRYLLGGILSAALYYGIWKLIQKALGIWTADTYNGMASVGDYNGTSVFGLIGLTYGKVWNFLIHPDMYVTVVFRNVDLSSVLSGILGGLNVAVLLIVLTLLIASYVKIFRGPLNLMLQVLLILLFPFGINLVCFLSKGMEHTLMTYAFCLIFIGEIKCVETEVLNKYGKWEADKAKKGIRKAALAGAAIALCTIFLGVWSNSVYGNQVSLKKELQEEAAEALMTRILTSIESAEGYEPGVTPVAISGNLDANPYVKGIENFESVAPYGTGITSLSYMGTDYAYLQYYENMGLNLTRIAFDNEAVRKMPCYPAEGSVTFVDGILVVKVSDM